jgi:uncharacterized protein YggE
MQRRLCIVLTVLAMAGPNAPALAQPAGQQTPDRYISVAGEGTANVAPDLAVVQAGVTTQGKTARAASEANSAAMAKVHAALDTSGIAERDIQTAQFSIRPIYDSRRDGDNRITNFQASNQVTVRVRALSKLAEVLDQMIAAGANDISGIHFTVSEPSKLLDNARAEAVADARRKAEQLAKAAGVRLGPPLAIVEDTGRPVPIEQRMSMRAAPAAAPPIAVGEQTLRVHVSVTFELLK